MGTTSRAVLLVGGASGLGLALAQRLVEASSTVIVGGQLTPAPSRSSRRRVASTRPSSASADVTRP